MSISGILPDIYVPTFELKVNDIRLPEPISKKILDISVSEDMNPPNSFNFRLNDPDLELIDQRAGLFTEGSRVEISMGYVSTTERAARQMILGEIVLLEVDFSDNGPVTVHVEGFDLLHRLTRGVYYRSFSIPDSQIVEQIAREMDLEYSVTPTHKRKQPRVQRGQNLEFLNKLAQMNSYFLWVDGRTLHFENQRPAPSNVRLEWGETLTRFSPRLSTARQVNVVEVRDEDQAQGQSFSSTARLSGSLTRLLAPTGLQQISVGPKSESWLVVADEPVSSEEEARTRAKKLLSERQQDFITGSGACVGDPNIRAGTELDIRGVGRFSGQYTVSQVTHTLGSGGYQTSFQVKRQI